METVGSLASLAMGLGLVLGLLVVVGVLVWASWGMDKLG